MSGETPRNSSFLESTQMPFVISRVNVYHEGPNLKVFAHAYDIKNRNQTFAIVVSPSEAPAGVIEKMRRVVEYFYEHVVETNLFKELEGKEFRIGDGLMVKVTDIVSYHSGPKLKIYFVDEGTGLDFEVLADEKESRDVVLDRMKETMREFYEKIRPSPLFQELNQKEFTF